MPEGYADAVNGTLMPHNSNINRLKDAGESSLNYKICYRYGIMQMVSSVNIYRFIYYGITNLNSCNLNIVISLNPNNFNIHVFKFQNHPVKYLLFCLSFSLTSIENRLHSHFGCIFNTQKKSARQFYSCLNNNCCL